MNHSDRMPTGILFSILLLLTGAGIARAQDVVTVSPETHKILLENDRVRVLGVQVRPGEKVGMHSHPASIIYYLSDANLRITHPDGKTEERACKAETVVWSEAVIHAAENVGTTELREIQIELKQAAEKSTPAMNKSP
jgi:quercetin dioxygenase-like cupin family protein